MIGKYHQTPSGAKQLGGRLQHLLQGLHLLIDLDAQGLEQLGHLLLLAVAPEEALHRFVELSRCLNRCQRTSLHDYRRQLTAIEQLAIEVEYLGQTLLVVGVDNIGGRAPLATVHAHIQLGIEAEREAQLTLIELMTRYAEVGQHAIELLHSVIAHPVPQVAEVTPHEGEACIIHNVAFRIGILVEAIQMCHIIHPAQHLA